MGIGSEVERQEEVQRPQKRQAAGGRHRDVRHVSGCMANMVLSNAQMLCVVRATMMVVVTMPVTAVWVVNGKKATEAYSEHAKTLNKDTKEKVSGMSHDHAWHAWLCIGCEQSGWLRACEAQPVQRRCGRVSSAGTPREFAEGGEVCLHSQTSRNPTPRGWMSTPARAALQNPSGTSGRSACGPSQRLRCTRAGHRWAIWSVNSRSAWIWMWARHETSAQRQTNTGVQTRCYVRAQ